MNTIIIILLSIVFISLIRHFFTKWMHSPSTYYRQASILAAILTIISLVLGGQKWISTLKYTFINNENSLLYGIILILIGIVFFGIIATVKDESKAKKIKTSLSFFMLAVFVFLILQTVNPCLRGGRNSGYRKECIEFKTTATLRQDHIPSILLTLAGLILLGAACKNIDDLLGNKKNQTTA